MRKPSAGALGASPPIVRKIPRLAGVIPHDRGEYRQPRAGAEQMLLAGYADPAIVEIEALYPKGRREPVATAPPDALPYALWFIVVPSDGPAPAWRCWWR